MSTFSNNKTTNSIVYCRGLWTTSVFGMALEIVDSRDQHVKFREFGLCAHKFGSGWMLECCCHTTFYLSHDWSSKIREHQGLNGRNSSDCARKYKFSIIPKLGKSSPDGFPQLLYQILSADPKTLEVILAVADSSHGPVLPLVVSHLCKPDKFYNEIPVDFL